MLKLGNILFYWFPYVNITSYGNVAMATSPRIIVLSWPLTGLNHKHLGYISIFRHKTLRMTCGGLLGYQLLELWSVSLLAEDLKTMTNNHTLLLD